MKIEMRKTDELIPYERNQKKHDEKQIQNVANSIKRFGWQQPIVIDKKDVVVIGHCRLLAAQKLGLDEVPVTVADNLTEDEIRELRIADNKTNESPWDDDLLSRDIEELSFDGFDFDFDLKLKDKDGKKDAEPEVPFTEVLGEENNYLILQFKTEVDWLQALSVFDIHNVKALSTRKDGKISEKMTRVGVGRVLDGAKALNRLVGDV